MVYRTVAFIDKCAITIPVPQEYWDIAEQNISELPYRNSNCSPARIASHGPRPQLYLASWTYHPKHSDINEKFYLQAFPLIPGISFMRIEWNPRKIKNNGFIELIEVLAACIPNFRLALADATITRADIAFDVSTSISNFFVLTFSAATLCDPWFKNEGRLNAYYLGSPKAPHKMLIYDKNFEQFQGTKMRSTAGGIRLMREKTRCELRITRLGKINQISIAPNPFRRYIFADRKKASNHQGDANWRRFLQRCSRSTAQREMRCYTTQAQRSKYRKALNECTPNWYDSEKIWIEARAALKNIFFS